jgi:hypothetical protein
MMGAVRISETSGYFHETTGRYIPEGFHLHTRRSESLKSLMTFFDGDCVCLSITEYNIQHCVGKQVVIRSGSTASMCGYFP